MLKKYKKGSSDLGLGKEVTEESRQRMVNKDGTFNVKKKGSLTNIKKMGPDSINFSRIYIFKIDFLLKLFFFINKMYHEVY